VRGVGEKGLEPLTFRV